jgi:hypothetical protein
MFHINPTGTGFIAFSAANAFFLVTLDRHRGCFRNDSQQCSVWAKETAPEVRYEYTENQYGSDNYGGRDANIAKEMHHPCFCREIVRGTDECFQFLATHFEHGDQEKGQGDIFGNEHPEFNFAFDGDCFTKFTADFIKQIVQESQMEGKLY